MTILFSRPQIFDMEIFDTCIQYLHDVFHTDSVDSIAVPFMTQILHSLFLYPQAAQKLLYRSAHLHNFEWMCAHFQCIECSFFDVHMNS